MINNLPIARTNSSTQASRGEANEILTPNRLILRRNNDRSLEGLDRSRTNLAGIFEKNLKIQKNFYELFIKNVFELIPQPKWYKNDADLKVDDIVMYVHKESAYTSDHYWRLGRVKEIIAKTKPVKAIIEYKNVGEMEFRTTERTTRELVVIHKVDDLDYNSRQHQQKLLVLSHFSINFQRIEDPVVKFVVVY